MLAGPRKGEARSRDTSRAAWWSAPTRPWRSETARFDKPRDRAAARAQLMALSGNTHQLHSAVAVVRGEEVLLDAVDTASLTMRPLVG